MKNFTLLILMLALGFAVAAAEWDFARPESVAQFKLRGASAIADGALKIPVAEISKPGGATSAKPAPEFSPAGAFRLTVTFKLDAAAEIKPGITHLTLFDNRYVITPKPDKDRGGLMFYLRRNQDKFIPAAAFAIAGKACHATGQALTLKPGQTYTLGLVFSATGQVKFTLDGQNVGDATVPPGRVTPATYPTVIGDRVGSNYAPLGGAITKVVLTDEKIREFTLAPSPVQRRVFVRGEKTPDFHARIQNFSASPHTRPEVTAAVKGVPGALPVRWQSDDEFILPVDTRLLPGNYQFELTAAIAGEVVDQMILDFTIVPDPGDYLPVILWGGADPKLVKTTGFTHQAVTATPFKDDYDPEKTPALIAGLDHQLRHGLYGYNSLFAQYRFTKAKRYLRVDRAGKTYPRDPVEASNPAVSGEFDAIVTATARALGEHPAWAMMLSNSEVRDSSMPSFRAGGEPEDFKKFSGFDIPATINGKYPTPYKSNPNFPWDRIVSEKDPELVYLKWFYREGDGWNKLHSRLTATMHREIQRPFTTFYDPAIRVPPLWGSGGKADAIAQWSYVYPDPIKIGQATDELIAMAQGTPGQKVMKMTQAIWYRSQTAPAGVKVPQTPEWVAREPQALYITIAPDALREALWVKLSRRLDAIMYHGSGSLLAPAKGAYRYTNTESKDVLREMSETLIKPLGPVLKRIPERQPEVGILESFTSSLYAPQHFSAGWSKNWVADLHLALSWANWQPVVFFEEHLLRGDLTPAVKVLFVPGAEVLTDAVLAKLQAYQNAGGIIVGDEFTTPALMLDYRLRSVKRVTADPVGSKQRLVELGHSIRTALAADYRSPVTTTDSDIVVRRRGSDAADYVFAVNDKRTFGDYLGAWRLVAEKGVPVSGKITVHHESGAAYDLVRHLPIPFQSARGRTEFSVALPGGDGALVLLLDRPIAKLALQTPDSVRRGDAYTISCSVQDAAGKNIAAILPLELTVRDAAGATLPGSGYYATAPDGTLHAQLLAAPNQPAGDATVTVRSLASGITRNVKLKDFFR